MCAASADNGSPHGWEKIIVITCIIGILATLWIIPDYGVYHFIYSLFNGIIFTFYQQQSKISVAKWLPALPLLHFLRQESKPFEDVVIEEPSGGNWKWWGLEGFSYRDIRNCITGRFGSFLVLSSVNYLHM